MSNKGGCKFTKGRETIIVGLTQPPVREGETVTGIETPTNHTDCVSSLFFFNSHFKVILFCFLSLRAKALKKLCTLGHGFDHSFSHVWCLLGHRGLESFWMIRQGSANYGTSVRKCTSLAMNSFSFFCALKCAPPFNQSNLKTSRPDAHISLKCVWWCTDTDAWVKCYNASTINTHAYWHTSTDVMALAVGQIVLISLLPSSVTISPHTYSFAYHFHPSFTHTQTELPAQQSANKINACWNEHVSLLELTKSKCLTQLLYHLTCNIGELTHKPSLVPINLSSCLSANQEATERCLASNYSRSDWLEEADRSKPFQDLRVKEFH